MDTKKTVSLLSLNAYMIPGVFAAKEHQTCDRQDTRADLIGQFAKDKDLIVLQEMWGSQVYPLQVYLEKTHTIQQEYRSWAPFGAWSGTVLDSMRFFLSKNGGLWFACKNDIPILHSVKHQFSVSESSSGKGAQLVVLDMKNYWGPDTWLILCNTHLDPTNTEHQRQQMKEIYQFIGTVLPTLPTTIANFSVEKSAFIVCGDFNISSAEQMYTEDVPQIFHNCAVDLYKEYITKVGVKEDFTYEGYNTLSAGGGRGQYQVRIDYVFRFNQYIFANSTEGPSSVTFLKVVATDAQIHKQPPGKEFSDHWTLSFQLALEL